MLKKIFKTAPPKKERGKTIIVVSGLPRSGTSMMMKMLAEGGVPAVSDSIRNADEDNPNGYFEFEPVKQLSEGQYEWLADADHKAVKVVSALLEYLPSTHHYKILFMERDIKEILASQRKMLDRRKEESKVAMLKWKTSSASTWQPSNIGWPGSLPWKYFMSITTN